MKIDPICGMTVEPDKTAEIEEYNGESWYFCSEHCHVKFNADPDRYAVTRVGNTLYTCPMHPEILQQEPGSCPKCGVALEPLAWHWSHL